MGRFDGFLFCVDCDGTLTNKKGEITPKNVEAILEFQREGGLFTFASGRFPKYIRRFFHYFQPNTYQIMANGTSLYDVYHEAFIDEVTLPICREPLRFMAEQTPCVTLFVDHRNHSTLWCRREGGLPWDTGMKYTTNIEDLFLPEEEPWHKINFVFETPEDNRRVCEEMRKRFPEFQFVRSWQTGMELLPLGGGKGNALLKLKRILGDKVHTVVAAGDFENDISMLQVADLGYAVENACEECKQAANRFTVSCDEDAIFAILQDLKKEC